MTARGFVGAASATGAVVSSCLTCGKAIPRGRSYCGKHRPVGQSARLRGSGGARERFRREVFKAAGGRCEAVIAGVRCDVTDASVLEAHHVLPVSAGGGSDASNGRLLCRRHHLMIQALIESRKLA